MFEIQHLCDNIYSKQFNVNALSDLFLNKKLKTSSFLKFLRSLAILEPIEKSKKI